MSQAEIFILASQQSAWQYRPLIAESEDTATVILHNTYAGVSLTGLSVIGQENGLARRLVNSGTYDINLLAENTESAAGNRFASAVTIKPNSEMLVVYRDSRWRVQPGVSASAAFLEGATESVSDASEGPEVNLEVTDVFVAHRDAVARRDVITLAGGSLDGLISAAVARVLDITCAGIGSTDETITFGNLTGIVGVDFEIGADETELCTNILNWIDAHWDEISDPSPNNFVDNEDGTGSLTFAAGAAANDIVCSTTDPNISLSTSTDGEDEVQPYITIAGQTFTGGGDYPSDGSDFANWASASELGTALDDLLPITGISQVEVDGDTVLLDYDAGDQAYAVPTSNDANFSAETTIDGADELMLYPDPVETYNVGESGESRVLTITSATTIDGSNWKDYTNRILKVTSAMSFDFNRAELADTGFHCTIYNFATGGVYCGGVNMCSLAGMDSIYGTDQFSGAKDYIVATIEEVDGDLCLTAPDEVLYAN